MPISEDTQANVVRMSVSVSEVGTDAFVSFDVPVPIPAGMTMTESDARGFHQKIVNALEASPDLYGVSGQLVTELRATCTADGA